MKSRWVGILVVSVLVLWIAGCSSSATDSEADDYGFAALQIQWPETAGMTEAVASGENGGSPLPAADRQLAKAYFFDGCLARDVVTIVVEVHDDHERHLVSESFACAERIGVIEHIATGPGRHFIVKALDADEALRYYGEKTEVAIAPGFNDVGVINMLSVGDVIVPPEVTITAPEDGSVYLQGEEIVFEGGAIDMESALTGDALVWASDIDDSFGTGNSFSYAGLSPGTHAITLTATGGGGNTGESSISITIDESGNAGPEVNILRPFDGSRHTSNGNIFFEGEALDPEDGALTGDALVWKSDRDGGIGFGSSFVTSLSAGVHEITLTAVDSEGVASQDIVVITVIVARLPDTGQTRSYTATFGEDSDYTINPPSYTKLDAAGMALPDDAASWSMVRDNVTGLVWEVKTTDSSIHSTNNRYTWEEAGGDFIQTLNQQRFGGYDDWRLPTVMELYTIIHADNVYPSVNTGYFPNVPDVDRPYYWSATPRADSPNEWIWVIDFGKGEPVFYEEETHYVRAVRGGLFRTARMANNLDGTVTDNRTGLIWQLWETTGDWEDGLVACEGSVLAGYTDWRLPNRNELHSLVDYRLFAPAMDTDIFMENSDGYYWSSTSSPEQEGEAYTVEFDLGFGGYYVKWEYNNMIRCVRGGR